MMKDDPEFNVQFVGVISRYPCIYDLNSVDYCKRNEREEAWESVATLVSESVPDCKERWKNIRGCYTRYLKNVGESSGCIKNKRPYYLANSLRFLRHFVKTRKSLRVTTTSSKNSQSDADDDSEESITTELEPIRCEDIKSEPAVPENAENEEEYTMPMQNHNIPNSDMTSQEEDNKMDLEYFHAKASRDKRLEDDPDLAFFYSILPDMKLMNRNQKTRCKISILKLVAQILDESGSTLT